MPLSNPITLDNVIALWSGTPAGLFLRDDGVLTDPIPDYSGANDGDVMTLSGGAPAWVAPAGGGGYEKLTASGVHNGILTLWDEEASGETRFVIREGSDLTGYENLFEIQSTAGTPMVYIGGVNNGFTLYLQSSGLRDTNERYFAVNANGFIAPSDGAFSLCDGTNIYSTRDVRYRRSGTRIGCVEDENGDLAGFEVGTLYLDDGVTVLPVQWGANGTGPGGVGRALYFADA